MLVKRFVDNACISYRIYDDIDTINKAGDIHDKWLSHLENTECTILQTERIANKVKVLKIGGIKENLICDIWRTEYLGKRQKEVLESYTALGITPPISISTPCVLEIEWQRSPSIAPF